MLTLTGGPLSLAMHSELHLHYNYKMQYVGMENIDNEVY